MLRKCVWLTTNDVEDHFIALCDDPEPDARDKARPLLDPFAGTERFIRTFSDPGPAQVACLGYLKGLRARMQRGGIGNAD